MPVHDRTHHRKQSHCHCTLLSHGIPFDKGVLNISFFTGLARRPSDNIDLAILEVQTADSILLSRFLGALVHESNIEHNALIDNTVSELDTISCFVFRMSIGCLLGLIHDRFPIEIRVSHGHTLIVGGSVVEAGIE